MPADVSPTELGHGGMKDWSERVPIAEPARSLGTSHLDLGMPENMRHASAI